MEHAKKIGVTLSGGGARGIAHLGVLKAFDDLGIPIHVFSGTSSGAIVAAFYAAGFSPEVILKIITGKNIGLLMRPSFHRGIMHLDKVEKLLTEYLGNISFEDLKIPLTVSATDLNEGVTVYFSSGKLIKVLIASSSVPILYRPVRMDGRLLADGGMLNNLPIEGLMDKADIKIGVHSNPVNHQASVKSFRNIVERTFHLLINNTIQPRLPYCDLFIEPPGLQHFSMLAYSKAEQFFTIGYEHTMTLADTLLEYKSLAASAPSSDSSVRKGGLASS
jgi:NTE family protein